MVADEALNSQIAVYAGEAQMTCQFYCEQQLKEERNQNLQLTDDSSVALEKQCNKLCIKKFFNAYKIHQKRAKADK
jgi:hypothetical protein